MEIAMSIDKERLKEAFVSVIFLLAILAPSVKNWREILHHFLP